MTLISTAELAAMQAQQAEALPSTATLYSGSAASDGAGGQTQTWVSGGSVAARVCAPRGTLQVIAERLAAPAAVQVTLPANTAVSVGHRVTVDGHNYRVVFVQQPTAWETARRCLAVEEL